MLVFKRIGGLGNFLIQLSSMDEKCTRLHDSVFKDEVSNCLIFNGFTRVSEEGEQPDSPIYINQYTLQHVHSKIRNILEPTEFMKKLIAEHESILDGVTCGITIRRGSYAEDSREHTDGTEKDISYYFCSDEGLQKFEQIVEQAKGYVFLTSDSKSVIDRFVSKYGDKIRTLNKNTFTIMGNAVNDPKIEDHHNVFLKFFMLSKCPVIYLTGGRGDMVGFSTYGYMAGVYGNKPMPIVFNQT